MIIYGGENEKGEIVSDVYLYKINENDWFECTSIEKFPSISFFSQCVIENDVYIFGGYVLKDKTKETSNDMYKISVNISPSEKKFSVTFEKKSESTVDDVAKRSAPCPRRGHCCVTYNNKYIIIIGGANQENKPLNDLWIYDITTNKFNEIKLNNNEEFEPRLGHSALCYGDIIAIYGGMQNMETCLDSLVILCIENSALPVNNKTEKALAYNGKYTNITILVKNKASNEIEVEEGSDSEKGAPSVSENEVQNQQLMENYNKKLENNIIRNESTDTNDLFNMIEFNLQEMKKNYLNNLITWTFLQKLSDFNQWPIGCIGDFIKNSLKDEVKAKNIEIDFITKKGKDILTIFDDGIGIDCKKFNSILFSFTVNKNKEYNYFQYGLSMKTSAIRIANSFLLISKTEYEISIGVISKTLQNKIDSDLILTPIVNFNFNKATNELTAKSNFPNESQLLILEETDFLFESKEELKEYLLSIPNGTRIFLYNLKEIGVLEEDINLNIKSKYELIFNKEQEDILLNTPFQEEFSNINVTYIDISLVQYLSFFRLEHSKTTKIFLYGKELELENPYYNIKLLSNTSNIPTKIYSLSYNPENEEKKNAFNLMSETYKGIFFNEKFIDEISENGNCDMEDIKAKDYLNGILLYENNYLISRINQTKFGDLSFFISKILKEKDKFFHINGYLELPEKNYELMFHGKEIKDLALFSFLRNKIRALLHWIKKKP